jgi:hypothetical protein
MKKPTDVADLAARLANAASTPLVVHPPVPAEPAAPASRAAAETPRPQKPRKKAPNRGTVSVFLRMPQPLYEEYDQEAVRRTKQKGRGVTVQQVILDRLEAGKRA